MSVGRAGSCGLIFRPVTASGISSTVPRHVAVSPSTLTTTGAPRRMRPVSASSTSASTRSRSRSATVAIRAPRSTVSPVETCLPRTTPESGETMRDLPIRAASRSDSARAVSRRARGRVAVALGPVDGLPRPDLPLEELPGAGDLHLGEPQVGLGLGEPGLRFRERRALLVGAELGEDVPLPHALLLLDGDALERAGEVGSDDDLLPRVGGHAALRDDAGGRRSEGERPAGRIRRRVGGVLDGEDAGSEERSGGNGVEEELLRGHGVSP